MTPCDGCHKEEKEYIKSEDRILCSPTNQEF